MRIYRRQEFMKLPEGTIFAKGQPWYFEPPCVKGKTYTGSEGEPIDFAERQLVNISANNTEEWLVRLTAMLDKQTSYPIDDCYGRDGCFDDDDIFLVYEEEDLMELQTLINEAIKTGKSNKITGKV